jgi:hypothetical protein
VTGSTSSIGPTACRIQGSATSFDAQINNGGIAQIFSPGASVRRITLGNLSGQGGGLLVDLGSLNVTENLRLGENGGMGNMTIRNDADVSASQTILGVFSGSGLMTGLRQWLDAHLEHADPCRTRVGHHGRPRRRRRFRIFGLSSRMPPHRLWEG